MDCQTTVRLDRAMKERLDQIAAEESRKLDSAIGRGDVIREAILIAYFGKKRKEA